MDLALRSLVLASLAALCGCSDTDAKQDTSADSTGSGDADPQMTTEPGSAADATESHGGAEDSGTTGHHDTTANPGTATTQTTSPTTDGSGSDSSTDSDSGSSTDTGDDTSVPDLQCEAGLEQCYPGAVDIPGAQAHQILLTDLNADTHLDAVFTYDTGVSFFLGDGTGSLVQSDVIPTGPTQSPLYIAAGDLDADGTMDVAFSVGSTNTPHVVIAFGAGDGTVASQVEYGLIGSASGIVLADFDDDGDLDIAAGDREFGTIGVRLNDGAGSMGAQTSYPLAGLMVVVKLGAADVDANGTLDVYAGATSAGVVVLPGLGDGTFDAAAVHTLDMGGTINAPVFVDIEGDGDLDLIAGRRVSDSQLVIRRGDAGGVLGETQFPFSTGGGDPEWPHVADFDKDGALDVAVLNLLNPRNLAVLRGDGLGALHDPVILQTYPQGIPQHVVAGDLNEDGVPDLVVGVIGTGVPNSVQVHLSNP